MEMWYIMIKINFAEYKRVYIPINIKPYDSTVLFPERFKVDTGADKTTISKLALNRLGYNAQWVKENTVTFKDDDKPTTAAGDKVNAGYIQLPLINILGYEGIYWPFQIITDENQDFRNLLGRDLLTGFNYTFNNYAGVLSIEKTKLFKPLYYFLPKQEINEISYMRK